MDRDRSLNHTSARANLFEQMTRASRLRETDGSFCVSYYASDQGEECAHVALIRSFAHRMRLKILEQGGGQGRNWVRLLPLELAAPRVCSGTRGRGKAKAKARRARARAAESFFAYVRRNAGQLWNLPVEIAMMWRRTRRRRGPKGNRWLRGAS